MVVIIDYEREGWFVGSTDEETMRRLERGEKPGVEGITLDNVLAAMGCGALLLLMLAVIIIAGARLIDWVVVP